MGMSINSGAISGVHNSYGAYRQKLTKETQAKLDEHNIPYQQNISEEEGKKLLASYGIKDDANEHSNANHSGNQAKNSLYEDAVELAKKIGVEVSEKEEFKVLLNKIEIKLEEKIQASSQDMDALEELKGYSLELASIQAQANGNTSFNNLNQALMMSLEMLGEYNKNFLKL